MRIDLFKGGALVACLAALALSACGSDDDDGGNDETATGNELLAHDEFVDQATTACEEAQEASGELNERLGEVDVLAPEAASLLEDLAGVTDELVSDLQTLEPATDDSADYETLIGLLEDATAKVEEIAAAVREGDQETALSVQSEVNTSGEKLERVTTDLHLTACIAVTETTTVTTEPEAETDAGTTTPPSDDASGEASDLPPCSEGVLPCVNPDGSVTEQADGGGVDGSGEAADLPLCSEGPPPCRTPDGAVVEP